MTEIATPETGALAVRSGQTDWTPAQYEALKAIGLGGAPRGVALQFLTTCQRTGLDPWARQIYLLAVGNSFVTMTGIDGYRVIAKRTGKYRGQLPVEWCDDDGLWRDVWLRSDPPRAARVGVLHDDYREPVYGVALYDEYVATTTAGKPNATWQKRPAGQLAKCAESLALRRAFPNDLAGLYTREEMEQSGTRAHIVDAPAPDDAPTAPPRAVDKIRADALDAAAALDPQRLRALWREASGNGQLEIVTAGPTGEVGDIVPLREFLEHCAATIRQATMPPPPDRSEATNEPGPIPGHPPSDAADTGDLGAAP